MMSTRNCEAAEVQRFVCGVRSAMRISASTYIPQRGTGAASCRRPMLLHHMQRRQQSFHHASDRDDRWHNWEQLL